MPHEGISDDIYNLYFHREINKKKKKKKEK